MLILRVDDLSRAKQVLSAKGVKIATKDEIQEI
jgi:hypothetical protein